MKRLAARERARPSLGFAFLAVSIHRVGTVPRIPPALITCMRREILRTSSQWNWSEFEWQSIDCGQS